MELLVQISEHGGCHGLINVSEHGRHHSSHMIVLGLSSKPSFYAFLCQDDYEILMIAAQLLRRAGS